MSTRSLQFAELPQAGSEDVDSSDDEDASEKLREERVKQLAVLGVGVLFVLALIWLAIPSSDNTPSDPGGDLEWVNGGWQRAASCKQIGCNARYNHGFKCQCNTKCESFKNCCRDYAMLCSSRSGNDSHPYSFKEDRCESLGCEGAFLPGYPCQCTTSCAKYKNCCGDYVEKCTTPPPPTPPPPPEAPVMNPDYHPKVPSLRYVSTAPVLTFYMYRVQAPENQRSYPLENVNTASLGGVLWYLHNEIIYTCDWEGHKGHRKFDIARIIRFKVSTRATQPLADRGLNFGVKCSIDSGACTGPAHPPDFDKFGYYVGCDYLGEYPHEAFQSGKKYPDAIWYSLQGPCPFKKFFEETDQCRREHPGGHCKGDEPPTGAGDCTYIYEEAGDIDIDEMVGITPRFKDREEFCKKGCREGSANSRGTCGVNFWDDIWNEEKNKERVEHAKLMFKQKYPYMPGDEEHPPPKCDFSKEKYYK